MIKVWKAVLSLRLHWLLLITLCAVIFLNLVLSSQRYHSYNFTKRLGEGLRDLSKGVKEDENSAREEVDEEAKESSHADGNTAKEENSEQETGGDSTMMAPWNWRNLTNDEMSRLSVLGRRLFLEEDVGHVKDKVFTILIWKYGLIMEARFLREYGSVKKEPFRSCSAQNCRLTYNDEKAKTADAILFHTHRIKGPNDFPNRTKFDQRWIWLTDEASPNIFMMAKEKRLEYYNNKFNWSMSYRMDTDIPVPYGRTLRLTAQEIKQYEPVDYFSLNTKFVAIMGSNCGGQNQRWDYVRELQKHMTVDTYGGCGDIKCPGHFTQDCPLINGYKFYLSFENSNCEGYITEKVWWNSFNKGSVPVVMGAKKEDYNRYLPPNSFLHIDDFQTPQTLANYLMYLASNREEYMKLHTWRHKYRITNEHGYFKTPIFHYCRICEALNYNSQEPKTYTNLIAFWGKENYCYQHTWLQRLKALSTTTTTTTV